MAVSRCALLNRPLDLRDKTTKVTNNMVDKIASQVKELESANALQEFKKRPVKILCVGNCLVNKLCALLKLSGHVDAIFTSNLLNWGNYHEDSFLARADEADFIVGINAAESLLRHNVDDMTARYGDKFVMIPMIWLDGLTSLEMFSINGKNTFFGEQPLVEAALETSFDDMTRRFYAGQLQTGQRSRLDQSLATLAASEEDTVQISDFITNNFQNSPAAYAIAHPAPSVITELFIRLVARLELTKHYDVNLEPYQIGRLALPLGNRAFTPYDVDILELAYPYDIDWLVNTKNLMMLLEKSMKRADADAKA